MDWILIGMVYLHTLILMFLFKFSENDYNELAPKYVKAINHLLESCENNIFLRVFIKYNPILGFVLINKKNKYRIKNALYISLGGFFLTYTFLVFEQKLFHFNSLLYGFVVFFLAAYIIATCFQWMKAIKSFLMDKISTYIHNNYIFFIFICTVIISVTNCICCRWFITSDNPYRNVVYFFSYLVASLDILLFWKSMYLMLTNTKPKTNIKENYIFLLTMLIVMIILFCFAISIDYNWHQGYANMSGNPIDYLYYVMLTLTTVGFGDMYPTEYSGKILFVLLSLSQLFFITVFVSTFQSSKQERK